MAETPQTSPRLDELRRRWQENPESRVFLQLSEEYRRLDRTAEAAQTLEQGLANRPTDVAAMVALGRCRLELDDADGAVTVLEQVLSVDPAHLVANKHLVDAHLRRSDAERARDRLGFYRLLNERDPELDHFEYRLSRLEQGLAESPDDRPADDRTTGSFDPEATSPAIAVADERGEDTVATEPRADTAATVPDNGAGVYRPPVEPFGVLPPLEHLATHAVLDDGPFDLATLFPAGTGEVIGSTHLAEAAAPEPAPLAADTAPVETVDVADAEAANEALFVEEDLATAAVPIATVDEDPIPVDADAVFRTDRIPTIEDDPVADTAEIPEAVEPPEAGDETEDDDERSVEVPATVALAAIYQEQGYKDEAIKVLERVLETDPENAEARSRLATLTDATAPLTAAELGAGEPEPAEPPHDPTSEAVDLENDATQVLVRTVHGDAEADEASVTTEVEPPPVVEAEPVEAPVATEVEPPPFVEAEPVEAPVATEVEPPLVVEAEPVEAPVATEVAEPVADPPLEEPAFAEPPPLETAAETTAVLEAVPEVAEPVESPLEEAPVVEELAESPAAEPASGALPAGVTARKIHVLKRYLATLRASRARLEGDHVH